MSALSDTDVVVLAGGQGSRLRSVLGPDVPKLLAPVGERPFLEYLLDWLQGFGARRVILSLGHLAEAIDAYLSEHPRPGLVVDIVVETAPLGTAGALRFARPNVTAETALVMNGDGWVGADLGDFIAKHLASGAAATVMCVEVEDAGRFGHVEIAEDGKVAAFREKQAGIGGGAVNAGIYALSPAGWDMIAAAPGPSLEHDVFAKQPAGTLYAYDAGPVPFIDIGTPESLALAAEVIGGNDTGAPS